MAQCSLQKVGERAIKKGIAVEKARGQSAFEISHVQGAASHVMKAKSSTTDARDNRNVVFFSPQSTQLPPVLL